MTIKSLGFLFERLVPSVVGLARTQYWSLARERARFFLTRQFRPVTTRCGYRIDHPGQLIAWWFFAVEGRFFRIWTDKFPPTGTIIDIGANFGVFGWICRQRWPKARIIAFEPHPHLAGHCKSLGCYDQVFQTALGSTEKTVTLFVTSVDGFTASTDESARAKYTSEQIQVPCALLDSFGLKADMIKLDVDGAEPEVISGGMKTFLAAPLVMAECEGVQKVEAVGGLLRRKGVKLETMDYLFEK